MIDLNLHAAEAQRIAIERYFKQDVKSDTPALLKHMAGEVVEATEAYNDHFYNDTAVSYKELAGELADVITCALIIAANEKINIEVALVECQQKNANRVKEA